MLEEPGAAARARSKDWARAVPSSDQAIGPVSCKGGREVWRDAQGRLRVCTLAQALNSHGLELAAGAYTRFHADGRPHQSTLARPHQLKTATGLTVDCAAEHVSLSENGMLTHCRLTKPLTVQGVTCRTGESIAFYDDGSLLGATIDAPLQALGVSFAAGTGLSWHPGGQLKSGWLRHKMLLAGYPVQHRFEAYPSGALRAFELAAARVLAGHSFPEGSRLLLRSNGSLQSGHYISARGFLPHGEEWTDTRHLQFGCDGKQLSDRTEHRQDDIPEPP